MSAESIVFVRWLMSHDLLDVEKAKKDGIIGKSAVNYDLALNHAFSTEMLPFDADRICAIIDAHLTRQPDDTEREKVRKRILRWLKHPELGGEPQAAPPMPKWDDPRPRPMPKVDSPLCWCGDQLSKHDEEGQCRVCHCTNYGRST